MMTSPGRERGKRYNTVHRSRKEDCRHPQHKRKNQIKSFGVHNAAFGQVIAQPELLNSSPRCHSEITVDFFGIVSELHQTFLKHANIVSNVAVFNNIFDRCIRIQQTEKSLINLTTLCQMIRTLEKFNGLFERFVKNTEGSSESRYPSSISLCCISFTCLSQSPSLYTLPGTISYLL